MAKKRRSMSKKAGMEFDMSGWFILGLAAFVIALIVIFIVLFPKANSAISFIKNLFGVG